MKKALVITTALVIISGSGFFAGTAYSLDNFTEVLDKSGDDRVEIFHRAFTRNEDALKFNIKTRIESLKASGLKDDWLKNKYWAYTYATQESPDLAENHSKSLRNLSKLITFALTDTFPPNPAHSNLGSECAGTYNTTEPNNRGRTKGRTHFFANVVYSYLQMRDDRAEFNEYMFSLLNGWLYYETLCELSSKGKRSCNGADEVKTLYENAVNNIIETLTDQKKAPKLTFKGWDGKSAEDLPKYILGQITTNKSANFGIAFRDYMKKDWECYLVQTGVICPIEFVDKDNQTGIYPELAATSNWKATGSTSVLQKCENLWNVVEEQKKQDALLTDLYRIASCNSKDFTTYIGIQKYDDLETQSIKSNNKNEIITYEDDEPDGKYDVDGKSQNDAGSETMNIYQYEDENPKTIEKIESDDYNNSEQNVSLDDKNSNTYGNENKINIVNGETSLKRTNQFSKKNNEIKNGDIKFLLEDSDKENEIMMSEDDENTDKDYLNNTSQNGSRNNDEDKSQNYANLKNVNEIKDNDNNSGQSTVVLKYDSEKKASLAYEDSNEPVNDKNQNIIINESASLNRGKQSSEKDKTTIKIYKDYEEEGDDIDIPENNYNSSHLLKDDKKYVLEENKNNPFLGGRKLKKVVTKNNNNNQDKTEKTDKDYRGLLKKNTDVVKKDTVVKKSDNQNQNPFCVKLKKVVQKTGPSVGNNDKKQTTEMNENNNQRGDLFGVKLKKREEKKENITPEDVLSEMLEDDRMKSIMADCILTRSATQKLSSASYTGFDSITNAMLRRENAAKILESLIIAAEKDDCSRITNEKDAEPCKIARLFLYRLAVMLLTRQHKGAVKLLKQLNDNELTAQILQEYVRQLNQLDPKFGIDIESVKQSLLGKNVLAAAQLMAPISYQEYTDAQDKVNNTLYDKYKAQCARSLLGDFILKCISVIVEKREPLKKINWLTTIDGK